MIIARALRAHNYLDGMHPVFGEVIDGMSVVDAISNVATDSNDRPLVDIVINSTQVIPEFPSWIILPIFLITTFSVVVIRKRLTSTSYSQ